MCYWWLTFGCAVQCAVYAIFQIVTFPLKLTLSILNFKLDFITRIFTGFG
jgi:hypothetical protein